MTNSASEVVPAPTCENVFGKYQLSPIELVEPGRHGHVVERHAERELLHRLELDDDQVLALVVAGREGGYAQRVVSRRMISSTDAAG